MKLSTTALCALTLAGSCSLASVANAATITATAESDRKADVPASCNTSTQRIDGDFTLQANPGNPILTCLGDGVDETITWDFDFTGDANLAQFLSDVSSDSSNLISAIATFTIIPGSPGVITDGTWTPGIRSIRLNTVPDLPGRGELATISIDLLSRTFTPDVLIDVLTGGDAGKIPWGWGDDVIMHSATLELESRRNVPEPMALLGLLGVGLVLPAMKRATAQ